MVDAKRAEREMRRVGRDESLSDGRIVAGGATQAGSAHTRHILAVRVEVDEAVTALLLASVHLLEVAAAAAAVGRDL